MAQATEQYHSYPRRDKDSVLYVSCSMPHPLNYRGRANCEFIVPNKTACTHRAVDEEDISRYLPGLLNASLPGTGKGTLFPIL